MIWCATVNSDALLTASTPQGQNRTETFVSVGFRGFVYGSVCGNALML
jgi:hypothetical protein